MGVAIGKAGIFTDLMGVSFVKTVGGIILIDALIVGASMTRSGIADKKNGG